ncbi:rCG52672 [Rattus norvegicus]|uniref:RCG52672 n=1 Tax=Rattus norvegicus TaxID=10116 RepID=A6IQU8_RAT|nr:rCG52672 [Rattus norvegicus]
MVQSCNPRTMEVEAREPPLGCPWTLCSEKRSLVVRVTFCSHA